jgi:ssDNA-binding Zn-finger/Zn-ribbon topoisomerase 1
MKYNIDELKHYIFNQKLSYEEIGRKYNVTGAAIKKAAMRMGLSLPERRKKNSKETFNKGKTKYKKGICEVCGKEFIIYPNKTNRFCSTECATKHKHELNYQKILDGDSSIMRANYNPRAFKNDILEEQNGVCAICGCQPIHNNKPLVFVLDHIDGNAANNKRENLRCVCPNCDSQLDTFKSKNKNGARSYYRYHKN